MEIAAAQPAWQAARQATSRSSTAPTAGCAATALCMSRPGGNSPAARSRPARQVVQTCRTGVIAQAGSSQRQRAPIAPWLPSRVGHNRPPTPVHPAQRRNGGAGTQDSAPTMAGLLAHGSSTTRATFPDQSAQWRMPVPLSAYSCGGSRGVSPRSLFSLRLEAPSRSVYDQARGRSNNLRDGWSAVRQKPACGGFGDDTATALAIRRDGAGLG